uniref:Uncharacterized protein n=1 Tax=Rhizophora mucronata TaxID=61149 RepID=A0A2P2PI11_RHIMU
MRLHSKQNKLFYNMTKKRKGCGLKNVTIQL